MFLLILIFSFLLCYSNAVPEGFEDQGVHRVSGLVDVAFATEKNGNHLMFAITKEGQVYTVTNFETDDESNSEEILALDMVDIICENGERGLGTILAHPDFSSNRFVYMFYTKKNLDDSDGCVHDKQIGPRNTCSRFKVNDDLTIDPDSELVLFQTAPLHDKIHNGGDMAFGVDGMLYIVLGDVGERGQAYAQRTDNLFGSVLRITDTGDIPDDNPFLGDGTNRCHKTGKTSKGNICREIFAYGLRNPFRFTMNPHSTDKVRFLINDVGGKRWEETNVGGTDYPGVNYGWPTAEGPCDISSSTHCPVYDEYQDPFFWYEHNDEDQGAAVGITIVPPGVQWPSKYLEPSFFFADFVYGIIFLVEEDISSYCRDCNPPSSGHFYTEFHSWPRPVGLKFGPYKDSQAMYYTAREGSVNIRRIVYKSEGNSAPKAVFTVNNTVVKVGEIVEFDASETSDPDKNDKLTYQWDFGDGSPKETGITVQHTYTTGGTYIAKLRVQDSKEFTDNYELEISVGLVPTVEILSPDEDTEFSVGDFFTLEGEGNDGDGNPLDPENLHWEIRQHHGAHYHPFFSKTGKNVTIGPAPEPEDFLAATNSYLEIRLTGYDSIGLHSTVSRIILPKTVWLDFDSVPTGMTISIDEEILVLPQRILSWDKHKLRVLVPDQDDYEFSSWSNGAERNSIFRVSKRGTEVPKYIATFDEIKPPSSSPTLMPVAATSEPTTTPTLSPTTAPTISPTSSPTQSPTTSPTTSPTASPTTSPTTWPTIAPTEKPTLASVVVTADGPQTESSDEDVVEFSGNISNSMLIGLIVAVVVCVIH